MNRTVEPPAEDATRQAFADCYALCASCFEQPTEAFEDALETGELDAEVAARLEQLDLEIASSPPLEMSLRQAYLRTFEGFDGPAAAPIESVYEPWWDGTERGLLAGPPAADAERRFEAIDADIPASYPPDHLAVLLEYASLTLEAGRVDEYADFHDQHFDWLSAFGTRLEETGDVAFYAWVLEVTETVVDAAGEQLLEAGGGDR